MILNGDSISEIINALQPLIQSELKAARAQIAARKAKAEAAKRAAEPFDRRRRENALAKYARHREFQDEMRAAQSLSERAAIVARQRVLSLREQGRRADFAGEHATALRALQEYRGR